VNGRRRPEGYLTKSESAERLGVGEKTFDRRRAIGDLDAQVLRVGKQLWFLARDIEAHFKKCQKRGYL